MYTQKLFYLAPMFCEPNTLVCFIILRADTNYPVIDNQIRDCLRQYLLSLILGWYIFAWCLNVIFVQSVNLILHDLYIFHQKTTIMGNNRGYIHLTDICYFLGLQQKFHARNKIYWIKINRCIQQLMHCQIQNKPSRQL